LSSGEGSLKKSPARLSDIKGGDDGGVKDSSVLPLLTLPFESSQLKVLSHVTFSDINTSDSGLNNLTLSGFTVADCVHASRPDLIRRNPTLVA